MRILFLSAWFPYPPDNGSKIRVYHLLRALGARHEVTLVSFAFATARPREASELRRFCADVHTVCCSPFDSHRVIRSLRFLSAAPVITLPLSQMTRTVHQCLAHTDFDVVISSTEVMATYALSAPSAMPKILEEHNSMTRWAWERQREHVSNLKRLRRWLSWQKYRYYESRLFRKFDLCVMVSELDRKVSQQILSGSRGWVEVVPNGVDCQHNLFSLADTQPKTLVFNGALTYSPNYGAMRYFLSEIYPLVRWQIPDVTLTITGFTADVDMTGLQLDESVHFSGYVDDVRPLVSRASLCVVPIRQGGGTRIKILEAMALGTPVVATSKAAEGLDVLDGEHIMLADDPMTFVERIVRVLREPELRLRLATNARRLVEQRYDWAQIGRHFVELVEQVASQRAHTEMPL